MHKRIQYVRKMLKAQMQALDKSRSQSAEKTVMGICSDFQFTNDNEDSISRGYGW